MKSFILWFSLLFLILGCGGYKIRPNMTAEERFAIAKKMFEHHDYFDAKTQFKIITLNNPGAPFVDDAQFYLAESHFHLKEYLLAADEYSRLIRLYPRSEWVDDAQYKIGLSYYKLSPKPSLDQSYTVKAIEHFQRFLEDFPNSKLVPEVEKMLNVCRTKLAKKDYKNGELYRKLGDYYAALVYFNSVIDNYYDTKYVLDALFWKGECLYRMHRWQEARQAFETLLARFPKNNYKRKVIERLEKIDSKLQHVQTDGKAVTGNQKKN